MKGFAQTHLMRETAGFRLYSAFDEEMGFKRVLIQVFEQQLQNSVVGLLDGLPEVLQMPKFQVCAALNAVVYDYPLLGFFSDYARSRTYRPSDYQYLLRYLSDALAAAAFSQANSVDLSWDFECVLLNNAAYTGGQDVHIQFLLSQKASSDAELRSLLAAIAEKHMCKDGEKLRLLQRLCASAERRYADGYLRWVRRLEQPQGSDCELLLCAGVAPEPNENGTLKTLEALLQ